MLLITIVITPPKKVIRTTITFFLITFLITFSIFFTYIQKNRMQLFRNLIRIVH